MKILNLSVVLLAFVICIADIRADAPALLTYKEVDKQPQIISTEFAGYMKRVAEGKALQAVIALVVTEKGKVEDSSLMATDDEAFAKTTLELLPKWKFKAAIKGKQKVKCGTVIRVIVEPATINHKDGTKTLACQYGAFIYGAKEQDAKRMIYFANEPPHEVMSSKH